MENNFDNVFCELNLLCYQFPDSNATVWIDMFKKRANCLNMCYPPILYCWHMGCRSRVTWLCCQLIARPGSVTTMPLWPDPYHLVTKSTQTSQNINTYWKLLPSFVEISLCTDYVLWNLYYIHHTIAKWSMVVICIVCNHAHWTIKN